jgi:putative ABC transport system permease protein
MRRAKVRFGLLAGAVGLLVFLILFQQALLTGLINQFIGALRNQSADVLVYDAQARKNLEGSIILPDTAAAVAEVDGVAVAAGLGQGTFTVVAGGDERDAVIFGYELDGPGEPTTLIEGRLPTAAGEAVASSRNASDGFDIADQVEVVPNPGGQAVTLTVVGLAEEINYSVAPTMFVDFADFEAARRAVNPDAAQVLPSVIAVQVDDGADPAVVASTISETVEGVEALTRQMAVDESPSVASVRQSFTIILLLFYLVVPLVTGLFFLIVTFQKAGALTLLRAIGSPRRPLVLALLIQVVIVVLAGAVLATLLYWASTGWSSLGITVSARPIVVTTSVVLVLALLTSLAAVRRVLRIDPISATTGAGVQI